MPRQRFIWPELWEDPDIGRLSRDERLLFIGLFSLADDEGRILADPLYLRGAIFKYDVDLSVEAVRAMRDRIARTLPRSVRLYRADGREYIALLRWRRWQRPKYAQPSRIPPPPEEESPEETALGTDSGAGNTNTNTSAGQSPAPPSPHPAEPAAQTGTVEVVAIATIAANTTEASLQTNGTHPRSSDDHGLPEYGSSDSEETSSGSSASRETLLPGLGWDGLGNDRDGLINTNDHRPPDQPAPAPTARPQRGRVRVQYEPEFERAWAIYPRRVAKRQAYRAWKARLNDRLDDGRPITADMLLEATRAYAEECRRLRREPQYIMHGSTFWGPSHRFADYLRGAPARAAPPTERAFDRWVRGVMARDSA